MRTAQFRFSSADTEQPPATSPPDERMADAQLVLAFGDGQRLRSGRAIAVLRERFPAAQVVSCSTGTAIAGTHAVDEDVVVTVVRFDSSQVAAVVGTLPKPTDSEEVGAALARRLDRAGLRHVLVFAEGLHVNGSALARGIAGALPRGVLISGGLAGDGERFQQTFVGLNEVPAERQVVLVGLYGAHLSSGVGSRGGWESFGVDHTVTRSEGNVVHELDGRRPLDVYKELLGPLGYALPASGLMFPLKIRAHDGAKGVIRTILGVDEQTGSLTFAGDMPEGWRAKLMRTDLDALIAASGVAATQTVRELGGGQSSLVIAVSCIGRKLLLQRRTDEELSGAQAVLGADATLAGFYSYGELAPSGTHTPCDLHNQTMTLTSITER